MPEKQRRRVIPLREALIPNQFWDTWEKLDSRGKTAVVMGEMEALRIKGEKLESRVDALEERIEPED